VDSARNRFIGIEHMTEQELEEIRLALEKEVEEAEEEVPVDNAGHRSVERLIQRF